MEAGNYFAVLLMCSQTRTRLLHASDFRIAVSAGFHLGGCLSCALDDEVRFVHEMLTFIPNCKYLTRVAHSVSIGNLSISGGTYLVYMFGLGDEFAHNSNLEPLPVACTQY